MLIQHLWSIALVTILTSPHFNKLLLNWFICSNVFQRFLSLFVLFGPKINWHKYQICRFLRSNCVFSAQICRRKISPVLREASKDLVYQVQCHSDEWKGSSYSLQSSELSLFDWNYVSSNLFAQSCTGTDLMVWRNTWEMWVSPTHWTPPRQPMKQIQNEQHFAWGWNGYTQSTTYTLHKSS